MIADQSSSSHNQPAASQQDRQKIQLYIPPELQAGTYSNAVSVNVNSNEVILDMGYLIPASSPRTIRIVSRINMNHRTAESFMRILQDALLDFRNKQKQKKEQ